MASGDLVLLKERGTGKFGYMGEDCIAFYDKYLKLVNGCKKLDEKNSMIKGCCEGGKN